MEAINDDDLNDTAYYDQYSVEETDAAEQAALLASGSSEQILRNEKPRKRTSRRKQKALKKAKMADEEQKIKEAFGKSTATYSTEEERNRAWLEGQNIYWKMRLGGSKSRVAVAAAFPSTPERLAAFARSNSPSAQARGRSPTRTSASRSPSPSRSRSGSPSPTHSGNGFASTTSGTGFAPAGSSSSSSDSDDSSSSSDSSLSNKSSSKGRKKKKRRSTHLTINKNTARIAPLYNSSDIKKDFEAVVASKLKKAQSEANIYVGQHGPGSIRLDNLFSIEAIKQFSFLMKAMLFGAYLDPAELAKALPTTCKHVKSVEEALQLSLDEPSKGLWAMLLHVFPPNANATTSSTSGISNDLRRNILNILKESFGAASDVVETDLNGELERAISLDGNLHLTKLEDIDLSASQEYVRWVVDLLKKILNGTTTSVEAKMKSKFVEHFLDFMSKSPHNSPAHRTLDSGAILPYPTLERLVMIRYAFLRERKQLAHDARNRGIIADTDEESKVNQAPVKWTKKPKKKRPQLPSVPKAPPAVSTAPNEATALLANIQALQRQHAALVAHSAATQPQPQPGLPAGGTVPTGIPCNGCGRQATPKHTQATCNFGSNSNDSGKAHPDFVYHPHKWMGSKSQKDLAKVKHQKTGEPFRSLQYRQRAQLVNGEWKLVPTTDGPAKPQVTSTSHDPSIVIADITSVYALLHREDKHIQGWVDGSPISALIDTGALDYSYISRTLANQHELLVHKLPYSLHIRSVHTTSVANDFAFLNVTLKLNDISLPMNIPCIILDNSPRDLIVGLPHIRQYEILKKFEKYFSNDSIDMDEEERYAFHRINYIAPEWVQELNVPLVTVHSNWTNLACHSPQSQLLCPLNSDASSDTSQRRANANTDAFPTLNANGYEHRSPVDRLIVSGATGRMSGVPLVTPAHPLPDNYELLHRDSVLDSTVPRDDDMMTDDMIRDLPDPSATEEPSEPEVFGSPGLQRKLRRLIAKYKHIFSPTLPATPAKISPITFNIDKAKWQEDRRTRQYPRPLSRDKEIALEKWIKAALESKIISEAPTVPSWSQILLVMKQNGKDYRFCVDYTVLNSFMESAGWPIPHIGAILRRIASHRPKYFATMDTTQGFYQMEVEMSSREFLCFTTYLGNYVWNRAPMGPKTVPAAFQRAMCMEVFPDLVHKIMEVYIDDLIVWASSEEELITRLEQVFARVAEKDVRLNPRKCRFGMEEVEYCGHILNDRGITFSEKRISEVSEFAVPEDHGGLKSFLGMAGYMREHVDHYVDIVHPLQTIVTHYSKRLKKTKIEWTPELLEAFALVKQAIANVHTLHHRNENYPLRLYTDASKYGIGAYLCQIAILPDSTVQEQPIGFISKSLSETERRWSVYEKEAYAIFYACNKWEHFIRGNHFYLFTDHKNLTFLNRPPSEKVMRWRLAIQEFDFSIAYIKGEKNNVADALSRCLPNPKYQAQEGEDVGPRPTTLDYITGKAAPFPIIPEVPAQWYDQLCEHAQYFVPNDEIEMFCGLTIGEPQTLNFSTKTTEVHHMSTKGPTLEAHKFQRVFPEFLLCLTEADKHELVMHDEAPLPERTKQILSKVHGTHVGHGGVNRTMGLLDELRKKDPDLIPILDSWVTKRADVKTFIRNCPICQKVKQHQLLKYTPHFTTSTYGIFDNISIDTIYMPESENGNKYLIVIIDSFSRYLDVYPVADLTAHTAMQCLITFMGNFGIPSHLCCDNGSQFQGIFSDLMDLIAINGYTTHAYSHQENSIVERANKEILSMLRCLILERKLHKSWDILCHVAKRIINSRVHSAIGIAPADLVFAGKVDLQRGSLFPYKVPPTLAGNEYMQTMLVHQTEMLRKAVLMQRERDQARLKDNDSTLKTIFPISSYVLIKPEVEPVDKLAPRWLGPYLITQRFERREGDVYRCLHLSTNKEFDFRVDRINPFYYDNDAVLHETAMLDQEQYEVEAVVSHRFIGTQTAKNLRLVIKWLGYEETQEQDFGDSTTGLKEVGVVHEYLRRHKLTKFVHDKFK